MNRRGTMGTTLIVGLAIAGCDPEARSDIAAVKESMQRVETNMKNVNEASKLVVRKAEDLERLVEELKKEQKSLSADLTQLSKSTVHLYPTPLPAGKSGTAVCAESGRLCLSMAPKAIKDDKGRVCGYLMADCNARVQERKGCSEEGETALDHVLTPTRFVKPANPEGQCEGPPGPLCIPSEKYEWALCIGQ